MIFLGPVNHVNGEGSCGSWSPALIMLMVRVHVAADPGTHVNGEWSYGSWSPALIMLMVRGHMAADPRLEIAGAVQLDYAQKPPPPRCVYLLTKAISLDKIMAVESFLGPRDIVSPKPEPRRLIVCWSFLGRKFLFGVSFLASSRPHEQASLIV